MILLLLHVSPFPIESLINIFRTDSYKIFTPTMTCSQQLLDQLLSQNKTLLSSQGKDVGPRQENLPLRQPQTFLPSQKLILSEREQSFFPDVGQSPLTSMGINYYPNSHLSHIPSQEQNSFHSQQQSFLPSNEQSFPPSQEQSFPTSQGLTADHFLSSQTASHKSPFLHHNPIQFRLFQSHSFHCNIVRHSNSGPLLHIIIHLL